MGIIDAKQFQDFLKKETVSWQEVITAARSMGYSPKDVLKILDTKFVADFYGKTDPMSFVLAAVYEEVLKREKIPYRAQEWIVRHYPGLVDKETITLSMHLHTNKYKKGSAKLKELKEKIRSKKNSIPLTYKRAIKHKNWDSFFKVYFRAKNMQKLTRKFYIR